MRAPATPATEISPAIAHILQIDEADIFAGNTEKSAHQLHPIQIPWARHSGIRGLDALGNGDLLVLTGPSGLTGDDPATVGTWTPGSHTLRPIGELSGLPTGWKAEGIAVASTDPLEFIIVCDGPEGGAPTRFRSPSP